MVKRKRIGLFFESYNTLPAYVIYITNIVKTLTLVSEEKKPVLIILHRFDSPIAELKKINYPYIEFYELQNIYKNPIKRLINKISRYSFNKNVLSFVDNAFPKDMDSLFPFGERTETKYIKHKIYWKPDFQEYHLPLYFTPSELEANRTFLNSLVKEPVDLVLSSNDAKRDFEKYFPLNKNKVNIVRFTSFLPAIDHLNINFIKKQYDISKPYFIIANQFWPHKNHLIVLKALNFAKLSNPVLSYQIVFTGKTSSTRDADLFQKIKFYISEHHLNVDIKFTDFISREEQVCLMNNSLAVIQPSLFEGWSTVIEDAKALNKYVIASDINVNKEQIIKNVTFFNPYNYKELKKAMDFVLTIQNKWENNNYNKEIIRFKNELEIVFGL